MVLKRSYGEIAFSVLCHAFVVLVCTVSIYPFLYVLAASLSSGKAILANKVVLLPVGMTLEAFRRLMGDVRLWVSYGNTIYITVGGTIIHMALTILAAYPLSKSRMRGRKIVLAMVVVTLFFGGGMIPTFMTYK